MALNSFFSLSYGPKTRDYDIDVGGGDDDDDDHHHHHADKDSFLRSLHM